MTDTYRAPQPRYIGDSVYATFDSVRVVLQTSDGIVSENRIGLPPGAFQEIESYSRYVRACHDAGEHLVSPACEDCGRDITAPLNPVAGAIRGEVYRVRDGIHQREIRLCRECARTVDEDFLQSLISKHPQPDATDVPPTDPEHLGEPKSHDPAPASYDFHSGISMTPTLISRIWADHRDVEADRPWAMLSDDERLSFATRIAAFIEKQLSDSFDMQSDSD